MSLFDMAEIVHVSKYTVTKFLDYINVGFVC